MILFILEGKTERRIVDTLKHLYFSDKEEEIVYCFENNIYQLYDALIRDYGDFSNINGSVDLFAILKKKHPDSDLSKVKKVSDISEIFLFFDYDFQHAYQIKEQHPERELANIIHEDDNKLQQMFSYFNEETDKGMLFINYPMSEALFYTKELPDLNYNQYQVTLEKCRHGLFKRLTDEHTTYKGQAGLLISHPRDIVKAHNNWEHLRAQNLKKAYFLCWGKDELPHNYEVVSQDRVFHAEMKYYDKTQHISILSSIPLFVFYYFK